MASNTGTESTNGSSSSKEAEKPLPIEPIRLPTAEEIRGQDIWNNCAVRSVVSGVMGMNQAPFFRFIFVIFANGFDSFSLFPFVWFPRKYEKAFFFFFLGQFVCFVHIFSESRNFFTFAPLSTFSQQPNKWILRYLSVMLVQLAQPVDGLVVKQDILQS